MNLKEKKEAFMRLCDPIFVESDRRLLRFQNPASGALTESGSKDKQEKEILWELLDYCEEKTIRENRQQIDPQPAAIPTVEPLKTVLPPKKKALTKRLNIQISIGRIWKMKMYKKPLSSITTGLIALKKYGNWTHNWTIGRQRGRLSES